MSDKLAINPNNKRPVVFVKCDGGYLARPLLDVKKNSARVRGKRELALDEKPDDPHLSQMVTATCKRCGKTRSMRLGDYITNPTCNGNTSRRRTNKPSVASKELLYYLKFIDYYIPAYTYKTVALSKKYAALPSVESSHLPLTYNESVMYTGYAVEYDNHKYELLVCEACQMLVWTKEHKNMLKKCHKCKKGNPCE